MTTTTTMKRDGAQLEGPCPKGDAGLVSIRKIPSDRVGSWKGSRPLQRQLQCIRSQASRTETSTAGPTVHPSLSSQQSISQLSHGRRRQLENSIRAHEIEYCELEFPLTRAAGHSRPAVRVEVDVSDCIANPQRNRVGVDVLDVSSIAGINRFAGSPKLKSGPAGSRPVKENLQTLPLQLLPASHRESC